MIELLNIFVNNIAPVLIVAGIGYLVGKRFQIESRSLGQLLFNVFSPALVFYSLYDNKIEGGELVTLLLLIALFQVTMAGLAYTVMRLRTARQLPERAFLRFEHGYSFDADPRRRYDGGVVEIKVGGGQWRGVASRFTHGGYNGRIAAGQFTEFGFQGTGAGAGTTLTCTAS